ncbi:hypothetical protein LCGC14_2728240, partial [marine sediment metagenome]
MFGQINSDDSGFKDYYPIAKRPYLSGGVGNNPYENIVFDAKPVVYYGIYNDIREALSKDTITPGDAIYISLQPQLRLYNENSKPVKTPSYKAFLGWQRILSTKNNNFFTAAFETGHYSNGQTGAAFSTEFEEGTDGGNAAYDAITDDTDLAAVLARAGTTELTSTGYDRADGVLTAEGTSQDDANDRAEFDAADPTFAGVSQLAA